jgi:hypothetical protein
LRWNDVDDEDAYRGELWVWIVLLGAVWMIAWNIVHSWMFNTESIPFPEDYESVAIETLVLYTLSTASYFFYRYNKVVHQPEHHRRRGRTIAREQAPQQTAAVAQNALASSKPAQNPTPEVILTKAPTQNEQTPPEHKA